MKRYTKIATLLAALVAGVAFAGDYIVFTQLQVGNGSNGMTQAAPSLATDGVGAQSSAFAFGSRPLADFAKVSIRASSTNTFLNATDFSWMRCWHYGPDPMSAGALTWKRCSAYDLEVDGGQSGKAIALNVNTMEFPPVGPLIIETPSTRYTWTGENLQQSGAALDAGVGVVVELITPP